MTVSLLFAWHFTFQGREMIVETAPSGESIVFEEAMRRRVCHRGKSWHEALIEDIRADAPSAARARKMEFGIRVVLSCEMMDVIIRARRAFDETGDVPSQIEQELARSFTPIFLSEVAPYLSDTA